MDPKVNSFNGRTQCNIFGVYLSFCINLTSSCSSWTSVEAILLKEPPRRGGEEEAMKREWDRQEGGKYDRRSHLQVEKKPRQIAIVKYPSYFSRLAQEIVISRVFARAFRTE